tara:strand:+ start:560 stop:1408 length:849 start_codon:yes stop_codon:yes gene_type:complete
MVMCVSLQPTFQSHDYVIQNKLSEGAFAEVFRVYKKNKADKSEYAMKRLVNTTSSKSFKRECKMLKSLNHVFICEFIESYSSNSHHHIILELIDGVELYSILRVNKLTIPRIRFVSASILSALIYMHSRTIIYRDLKPENIMVNKDGYITLVDLGFAKVVKDKTYTMCGTMDYVAPEIFTDKGYGLLADMWSFGVCLWEFADGKSPFWDTTTAGIKHKVIHDDIIIPKSFPRELQECVYNLLQRNVSIRRSSFATKWTSFFRSIDFERLEAKSQRSPLIGLV